MRKGNRSMFPGKQRRIAVLHDKFGPYNFELHSLRAA